MSAYDPKRTFARWVRVLVAGRHAVRGVTNEIGFDKTVTDRVFFMDACQTIEENEPEEFFNNPQTERIQLFLSQILQH